MSLRLRTYGVVGMVVVVGAFGLLMAMAGARAQAASFYCNEVVAPGYFCGVHLDAPGYFADNNQAYMPRGGSLSVCDRVAIRYQQHNVSFRCGEAQRVRGVTCASTVPST